MPKAVRVSPPHLMAAASREMAETVFEG